MSMNEEYRLLYLTAVKKARQKLGRAGEGQLQKRGIADQRS